MNTQKIKDNALKYLGYYDTTIDDNTNKIIEECIREIKEVADFKCVYNIYELNHQPLIADGVNLDYDELNKLFTNCNKIVFIAYTIGINIDKKIKNLSITNMSKMVVFDCVASSYLEYLSDEYDDSLELGKRTFRYCPGYGSVPLSVNSEIAKRLNVSKNIGLTIEDSSTLLPQKSMIGLIGLGDTSEDKSCRNCFNLKECNYRKRGSTCY